MMDHSDYTSQIELQARALRAAAVDAGPEAAVGTCPGWTVLDLVRHIARVHGWALAAVLRTGEVAEPPARVAVPEDWDELLPWWDEKVAELVEQLRTTPLDAPTRTTGGVPAAAAGWARRQAHETAIHRLDAEHARSATVPSLLFTPDLAADGVDEFLTLFLPVASRRKPVEHTGRVLLHAADAGRAWEVRLTPGGIPEIGPVTDSGTDEDVVVAGTADAVFRAVWGRPSGAIVSGNSALLDALPKV
ncbi:maleylpyruvate isomerase family mycothiol-dependent enzyme [Umezawaea sp. Da 62-37]|uniref:maleylpyruvate isomerase family mycothiol-dependent enzyme n=1 Tax=Umezawaea sp. Da 62-37 TaxID=3075927 RepID=UPI0028F6F983|nr:maleylpyruvate isomerase family mycothiol-dependent enzyme [Umezawaea sp. Da 62-37]WNV91080.1 maleylpyruvate isomerase family mycothiol-dependent enzyme [Umezawaea sp. Da 62-37]